MATIGSVATTINSGFAAKQIMIKLPSSITTLLHKVFTDCEFYAQEQLVVPANSINSEQAFANITSLTDIIFTATTFTNLRGWGIFNNTTANLVFPNATATPPAGSNMTAFRGYVYVPDALVNAWKAVSGWSNIASMIKPLSEWITE